jgi:NAD(P)H-hydrate epimerase
MAEVDRTAITTLGVPLEALMENAARQTASAARALLRTTEGKRVAALVGIGSNGGDALAALRRLLGWGVEVEGFIAAPLERLRPIARLQHDVLTRLGVPLHDASTVDDGFIASRLRGAHAILDGLLGYSIAGAPRGELARLIRLANAAGRPTVAIDLPSGLDPDTGGAAADVVRATLTVTLALPKPGLLRASRDVVGDLLLADIGIPPKAYAGAGVDASAVFTRGDLLRVVS